MALAQQQQHLKSVAWKLLSPLRIYTKFEKFSLSILIKESNNIHIKSWHFSINYAMIFLRPSQNSFLVEYNAALLNLTVVMQDKISSNTDKNWIRTHQKGLHNFFSKGIVINHSKKVIQNIDFHCQYNLFLDIFFRLACFCLKHFLL